MQKLIPIKNELKQLKLKQNVSLKYKIINAK